MFARFLIALLLMAFAVPGVAPAACHDAPVTAHAAHAMPMPSSAPDERVRPAHACIGCIPPSEGLGAVPARAPSPVADPVAKLSARLAGIAPIPHVPPPRIG